MGDFKDLTVWRRAHGLTIDLYRVTGSFPKSELFGLTQQIRRAVVSIEANLAEGCGRRTDRELARFALIANGSANELQCEILVARDLGYIDVNLHNLLQRQIGEIGSMLTGLVSKLRARESQTKLSKRETYDL